jgi:hypothetical protein
MIRRQPERSGCTPRASCAAASSALAPVRTCRAATGVPALESSPLTNAAGHRVRRHAIVFDLELVRHETLEEHADGGHGKAPPRRSGLPGRWRRALCNARAGGPLLGPPSRRARCIRSLRSRPLAGKRVYRPRNFDVPLRCASLRSEGVPVRPPGRFATLNITARRYVNAAGA